MEHTWDAGALTVNPLQAQSFKKEVGPGIGFQIAILQHPWSTHWDTNFTMGNHLDFRYRPIQFIIENHMHREGQHQTVLLKEMFYGGKFFAQPDCDRVLAGRIIQKQTINFGNHQGR
jgi:hypothetical protein